MSLISIIMPVYNGGKYLHLAIESVLAQTYTNFEFIIINDGSTDDTKNILEKYSKLDDRIKIITNSVNLKIVKSLNIGLNAAKGEFIARIDSDDIWKKDKLKIQISYFENDSQLYLLGTSKQLIDENGKKIKGVERQIYEYGEIRRNILKYNLFCHSSVLYKKVIIDEIGQYNEKYKNTEDYEYWIRIIKHFKTEILKDILVFYRISPQMVSLKKRKQQFYYVIKAKIFGFKLLGFYWKYLPFIIKDIYIISVPDFAIILKRKIKKLILIYRKKQSNFVI